MVAVASGAVIQQVGYGPVPEDIGETRVIAEGFQVGINSVRAVGLLGKQGTEVCAPPVLAGHVVHEEIGRAIVLRSAHVSGRPHGERCWPGSSKSKPACFRVSRHVYCQLRQTLINPRRFRGIGIPVDRVLQFVGQYQVVDLRTGTEGLDVDVDGFYLVAHRTDFLWVFVGGTVIAADTFQGCVQDVEVGIAIYARLPFGSENLGNRRVYRILELCRGLLDSLHVYL